MHLAGKLRVFVPILPSGSCYNNEESKFVTGIHKRGVLRIVSRTDNGKACIPQTFGVAPLLRVRKSIAYIGEVLVAIDANELVIALAIEVEAWGTARRRSVGSSGYTIGSSGIYKLEGTDADACDATIKAVLAVLYAGTYLI